MRLLDELRRGKVIRMAGLYLASAWLVTRVAGTVLPMLGARSVALLAAIRTARAAADAASWRMIATEGGSAACLAAARGVLGVVQAWSDLDIRAAEATLKKAVALDPANVEIHTPTDTGPP